MMLYILLCNILFIPVIYSGSNTIINTTLNPANVLNPSSIVNKLHKDVPNQPKLMVSEGGSLSPDDSSLSLPKKNSILPNLNNEELGIKKAKPVARRNGVSDPLKNNPTVIENSPLSNIHDSAEGNVKTSGNNTVATKNDKSENSKTKMPTTSISLDNVEKILAQNTPKIAHNSATLNNANESKINITGPNSLSTGSNKTEVPKKKLVLSYEALANMDDSQQTYIPAMKSSSKTLVNDQMPSPNADTNGIYPKNASRHPGLIMPAVITILVLPMFAVLGYMALRRGREAWKNRHYKRMDFLLDGMYND